MARASEPEGTPPGADAGRATRSGLSAGHRHSRSRRLGMPDRAGKHPRLSTPCPDFPSRPVKEAVEHKHPAENQHVNDWRAGNTPLSVLPERVGRRQQAGTFQVP